MALLASHYDDLEKLERELDDHIAASYEDRDTCRCLEDVPHFPIAPAMLKRLLHDMKYAEQLERTLHDYVVKTVSPGVCLANIDYKERFEKLQEERSDFTKIFGRLFWRRFTTKN